MIFSQIYQNILKNFNYIKIKNIIVYFYLFDQIVKKTIFIKNSYATILEKLRNSFKLFFIINQQQIENNKAIIYNYYLLLNKIFEYSFNNGLIINKKLWKKL